MVNALRTDLLPRAAELPGHPLNVAYSNKCRLYEELCETEGMAFIPLPFDTLGGLHEATMFQITKLGKSLARASGSDEDDTVRHLFQRASILLTKSNMSLILNRTPDLPPEMIDGNF